MADAPVDGTTPSCFSTLPLAPSHLVDLPSSSAQTLCLEPLRTFACCAPATCMTPKATPSDTLAVSSIVSCGIRCFKQVISMAKAAVVRMRRPRLTTKTSSFGILGLVPWGWSMRGPIRTGPSFTYASRRRLGSTTSTWCLGHCWANRALKPWPSSTDSPRPSRGGRWTSCALPTAGNSFQRNMNSSTSCDHLTLAPIDGLAWRMLSYCPLENTTQKLRTRQKYRDQRSNNTM
ncbi:hypothetical protein, variant [Aphanomyces astaci]|uniref:Uncharacterized protein n=1 Tax=Aphanomyces astaci TaxID=112090 RepID=W4FPJ0_APHAT|nr:hypothetical protein, variant [Aphanomyces astaci]ETV69390.1 hypothetical protein, variant [Aphanomyces astaci]|eukprot:XP_009841247.1 hypothetical protein, variant [Aphanomyces astaci]